MIRHTGWVQAVFFLACVFIGTITRGQEPFFRAVELEQSGSSTKINALTQDSRKIIWLASNEGIWKFSGTAFTKIILPVALSSEVITTLEASGDSILAGTKSGMLFSIRKDQARVWSMAPQKVTAPVSDILIWTGHGICFSTLGEGVVLFNQGRITRLTSADGLADDYVYSMDQDPKGRLFLGSDGGLTVIEPGYPINPGAVRNFSAANGLPENIIRKVLHINGDTLLLGTEERGCSLYEIGTGQKVLADDLDSWNSGSVTDIVADGETYWIGTQKSGILLYEIGSGHPGRMLSGGLPKTSGTITSLFRDHEGNIWVSDGSTLFISRGSRISFFRNYEGFGKSGIRTLMADSQGHVWFINDFGVFHLETKPSGRYEITMPLNGTPFEQLMVISLFEDVHGYVWMGTFDRGVLRFDPKTLQAVQITAADGLSNPSVLSVDGNENDIWFATLGGVSRCSLIGPGLRDYSRVEGFNGADGIGNNYIFKVVVDARDRAWFATDGHGISCFENGRFITYGPAQGLNSKIIYSLAEDLKGNIWLSSAGEGIYRFDGNSFRRFSLEQGLSDLNITSIGCDRFGNIVIVSQKGIDVMDSETFQVNTYGPESGIGNLEPDLNVMDSDRDGNFWIGSSIGIIRIKPEPGAGEKKPLLLLNQVLLFLEPTDTLGSSVFPHNRNHISFDFTGVWYADPEKLTYQYKLEGYNEEWITTRDRFVTFPNLRPGNYNFMVRTSLTSNFYNAPKVGYQFTITSPIWRRPWFIILVLVAAGSILYMYVRYRYNRLRAIEQIKKEKIEIQYEVLKNQVNPHFLFNSFNTLISVIEDDPAEAVDYVNRLSDFFRSILTYREKDLIPLREEFKLASDYVFLQQKRYGSNFKVAINVPENLMDSALVPPMAVQILLENCFKHNAVSRETPLTVTISAEDGHLLIIRNNINPRAIKEPSTGIGLQNLKNRYQLLNKSEVIIENDGRFFTVKIPVILAGG
jgi:ligand-binding sensor domain-containing protein